MTDKNMPSHASLAPATPALHVAIKPWLQGLLQRAAAKSAASTTVDLLAAHSTELYLKRGHWLIAQQGSCTIILPMQWQAECVVQSPQLVHEGDAWQVPASGYYQLSQRAGSQAATRSRVLISKAR